MALNKKQIFVLIGLSIILVSIIGMLIMKSEIEYDGSSTSDLYFAIFRFLFFATLVVFFADWFFRRWRAYQELKNERLAAELHNLKSQVSPHFFFNTLNNLYGLIKRDADKSREFVLKLSDLMRYSIYSSDKESVTLKEEIDYLENFIALHEIRYFNTVDIHFEKDMENDDIVIAPLLLIILLENAFKHGAEKLTNGAFIILNLKAQQKKLNFTVENNFEEDVLNETDGLGLKNLQKRLQLLYPEKYDFKVSTHDSVFKAELELEL